MKIRIIKKAIIYRQIETDGEKWLSEDSDF